MLSVIGMIIVLVLLCVWLTRYRQNGVKMPPDYPDRWPILGVAHLLIGMDTKYLFELMTKVGPFIIEAGGVIRANIGPIYIYGITDPEDSITIANQCLEKNYMYEFAKAWVGNGLVTVRDLKIWKRHSKIINRAFNLQVLNGYMDIFNKQSMRIVEELSVNLDKGPFDHMHVLEDILMKIMYQTVMGFNEEESNVLFDKNHMNIIKSAFQVITKRIMTVWMYSEFIYKFTALKKEEDKLLAYLHNKSNQIIKKKRELANSSAKKSPFLKSFLDLLLELPPEEAFTDQEIREEVDTMVIAGTDTSATTLTFVLMLLGSHHDVQEKVYKEKLSLEQCSENHAMELSSEHNENREMSHSFLKENQDNTLPNYEDLQNVLPVLREVFGDSFRDVKKQDLPRLEYLEAVLMETLRLYPILPMMPRYASKDVTLKNYTIPAGVSCLIFSYSIHRNPAEWGPDAAEFRPERWLPNPPPAAKAFYGFSLGKRSCIGRPFGLMVMKTILSHVLRHYKITAVVTKLVLQLDLSLKPSSGYEIAIEKRN